MFDEEDMSQTKLVSAPLSTLELRKLERKVAAAIVIDCNDLNPDSMADNKDDEHDDDEVMQETRATMFSFKDNASSNLRLYCLSFANELVAIEAPSTTPINLTACCQAGIFVIAFVEISAANQSVPS